MIIRGAGTCIRGNFTNGHWLSYGPQMVADTSWHTSKSILVIRRLKSKIYIIWHHRLQSMFYDSHCHSMSFANKLSNQEEDSILKRHTKRGTCQERQALKSIYCLYKNLRCWHKTIHLMTSYARSSSTLEPAILLPLLPCVKAIQSWCLGSWLCTHQDAPLIAARILVQKIGFL